MAELLRYSTRSFRLFVDFLNRVLGIPLFYFLGLFVALGEKARTYLTIELTWAGDKTSLNEGMTPLPLRIPSAIALSVFSACHFEFVKSGGCKVSSPLPSSR